MNLQNYTSMVEGLIVGSEFEGRPARVRHDDVSRTEESPLQMTNEMFPYRPVQDEKVNSYSKITMQLASRMDWVDRFREMMGAFVLGQFATPGFGWMDSNYNTYEYKFNLIQCGGNLVNVATVVSDYAYVETQNFFHPPNRKHTYQHAPHLNIKQVLVGRSAKQKIFWITDKKRGDIIFPAVSPVQASIPVQQLEFFPKLPWLTSLSGEPDPVLITAYCFVGSNTYGLINDQWLLIEEMEITGNGSHLDRKVYVDNWVETCPPPVIGWTREME